MSGSVPVRIPDMDGLPEYIHDLCRSRGLRQGVAIMHQPVAARYGGVLLYIQKTVDHQGVGTFGSRMGH